MKRVKFIQILEYFNKLILNNFFKNIFFIHLKLLCVNVLGKRTNFQYFGSGSSSVVRGHQQVTPMSDLTVPQLRSRCVQLTCGRVPSASPPPALLSSAPAAVSRKNVGAADFTSFGGRVHRSRHLPGQTQESDAHLGGSTISSN
jgi:hypothetical protein